MLFLPAILSSLFPSLRLGFLLAAAQSLCISFICQLLPTLSVVSSKLWFTYFFHPLSSAGHSAITHKYIPYAAKFIYKYFSYTGCLCTSIHLCMYIMHTNTLILTVFHNTYIYILPQTEKCVFIVNLAILLLLLL